MFSQRLPASVGSNAIARRLDALRRANGAVVDLTSSNPTMSGIAYPDGLLQPLADAAALRYEPDPFGIPDARRAVAADQRRRGAAVDPACVVLASSTSEAYSWLFKLLCDPGDQVLVPQPSYPLFEYLTALEGVRAQPYALTADGHWSIDWPSIDAASSATRAVLVVSPNNPTGSYLREGELERLTHTCRARGWALIADEVFADYPLDAVEPLTDIAARADCLAFTLGGLSKTVGLPQVKLAWIIAGGPGPDREAAMSGLELIADSYLSVGIPVQLAAPHLLEAGSAVRSAIQERIRINLDRLRQLEGRYPACRVLRVEGGWSAVVRIPSIAREEQVVLDLLESEHILVHPGYFFDFPYEAHLVVSLLPPPDPFAAAAARVFGFVSR